MKTSKKSAAKTQKGLNQKQEKFCQLYFGGGENFGNGVWSYIIAYELNVPLISYSSLDEEQKRSYEVAKANASELLTNTNIITRGDCLLDELIKNEIVDRELVRVIMQNEELSAKVSAIKEYNKLKQRIVDKTDITSGGKPIFDPELSAKSKQAIEDYLKSLKWLSPLTTHQTLL